MAQVYHLFDKLQKFISLPVLLLGGNISGLYLYLNTHSLNGCSYPGKVKYRCEAISHVTGAKNPAIKKGGKINE